jgi:hypothetical protein
MWLLLCPRFLYENIKQLCCKFNKLHFDHIVVILFFCIQSGFVRVHTAHVMVFLCPLTLPSFYFRILPLKRLFPLIIFDNSQLLSVLICLHVCSLLEHLECLYCNWQWLYCTECRIIIMIKMGVAAFINLYRPNFCASTIIAQNSFVGKTACKYRS